MAGPKILLTRIDNRLIHGQVGVTWVNHLGANLIGVANDNVSEDEVQQNIMDMVLPDVIQARYFSIEKTIDVIHKASPRQTTAGRWTRCCSRRSRPEPCPRSAASSWTCTR